MPDTDAHLDWQVVLVEPTRRNGKLVLYHPHSNTLQVTSPSASLPVLANQRRPRRRSKGSERPVLFDGAAQIEQVDSDEEITPPRTESPPNLCPLCYAPLDPPRRSTPTPRHRTLPLPDSSPERSDTSLRRIPSYFQLLSEVNSLANTPTTTHQTTALSESDSAAPLDQGQFNEGYFAKFFEEVQLLGRGGQGVVHLVRHLLNGEALGLYACKKIPVGDSTPSLLRILREVHLLEAIQHPNVISYHHAWLETLGAGPFAPAVPTLFVLMAFANGGSLLDFVNARGGGGSTAREETDVSPEEKKKRFRDRRNGAKAGRAVHLLKVQDILKLFGDVVLGLGFLHSRNVLHLDLKAENVLLHWDDEALLPACKLSDFGNATDDSFSIEREGGSGTLAYTAPEAFKVDPRSGKLTASTRASDLWGLGLILHLLCFFTLPYRHLDDTAQLEQEIQSYRGFYPSDADSLDHGTRHDLPESLLRLIARLVNIQPSERPSCDKVLQALAEIVKEVESCDWRDRSNKTELVPRLNRSHQLFSTSGLTPTNGISESKQEDRTLISRRPTPPSRAITNTPPKKSTTLQEVYLGPTLRSPLLQNRAFAGVVAFAKLSLHHFPSSSTGTSTTLLVNLLLLETILDVSVAKVPFTLFLSALHVLFVVFAIYLPRTMLF
ncbi:hypothetical protein JCM11491_001878 [Sporobolomyces phaffii]